MLKNKELVSILQNECLENIELSTNPFEDEEMILREDEPMMM